MPPPHLHPRSGATSALFAGTLLASFIVVGIPHVFPCPAPRRKMYAESPKVKLDENEEPIATIEKGDISAKQRGQRTPNSRAQIKQKQMEEEAALFKQLQEEAELLEKEARECPVPKPTGWLGRALGFGKTDSPSIETPKPTTSRNG